LKQLVPGPGFAHFKALSRRQSIFWWTRTQGGKVKKDYHQTLLIQFF